ncbi:hypothetical protein KCV06_g588, partial [Aureobasidium melanogenum]
MYADVKVAARIKIGEAQVVTRQMTYQPWSSEKSVIRTVLAEALLKTGAKFMARRNNAVAYSELEETMPQHVEKARYGEGDTRSYSSLCFEIRWHARTRAERNKAKQKAQGVSDGVRVRTRLGSSDNWRPAFVKLRCVAKLLVRESSLSPTVVLICRSTAYVWLTRMAAGRNSPVRGEAGKQTVVEQEIIPMLEALFSTSRQESGSGLSFDNSREEISRRAEHTLSTSVYSVSNKKLSASEISRDHLDQYCHVS